MVNPFGEKTSGSKYEWMAKYESEKNRADVLQSRIGEFKQLIQQYEDALNQLLKAKEDLETDNGYLRKMINERDEKLEQLQGSAGTRSTSSTSAPTTSQPVSQSSVAQSSHIDGIPKILGDTIIPMMCHFFNQADDRFENGYRDFVEAVIHIGDTDMKIIGLLIKHGGSGPLEKLRVSVGTSDFDYSLDQLTRMNLIKKVGNNITLGLVSEEMAVEESKWRTAPISELLDILKKQSESLSDPELVQSIEKFRDSIQNREIPATTIFFSIRKTIEALQRGQMDRKEFQQVLEEWRSKLT